MLTRQRQEEILLLVNDRGSITLQELMERFQASESTIRRDITALDQEGLLTKVFGGAVALHDRMIPGELSVPQKETVDIEERRRIAKYAASLIQPDDFVYLDAGTTTASMMEFIRETGATYVTNAVAHAKQLSIRGFHVILIGGELKGSTEAVVGTEAVANVEKYHFSKGFFGCNAIHPKHGLTTPDLAEALLKQSALKNTASGNRFVVTTARKFGLLSSITFSTLQGITILTDQKPLDEIWNEVQIIEVP